MRNAIVLAAGKGTRMHSDLPKVVHKIGDMPMVEVIVRNLKACGAERIVSVVGYGHEIVEKALEGMCEFAIQEPQLGTGHAVMQARQLEGEEGTTLVVNGDAATIQPETLSALYESVEDADMAVLTVSLEDAAAYGRVIRDEKGDVLKIVEFKDCTPEEAAAKIEEQRKEAGITEPKNLEEHAISLVGTDIYEKLIKGYTQKQW